MAARRCIRMIYVRAEEHAKVTYADLGTDFA